MEDLNPSVQTSEQPRAGLGAEAMLTNTVPESLGAQRPMEESTAAMDGLGGGEWLATSADESAATLGAMVGATGSSKADAGVVATMPESRVEKPVVPEE